jgi:hypothetical protein
MSKRNKVRTRRNGTLTCDEWPHCPSDRKTFADWRVDEIHEVCLLVNSEAKKDSASGDFSMCKERLLQVCSLDGIDHASTSDAGRSSARVVSRQMRKGIRQEMAKVVFSRPRDGITPAVFGGLCHHLVVELKWQVCLCFQRSKSLSVRSALALPTQGQVCLRLLTFFIGVNWTTLGSVKTPI